MLAAALAGVFVAWCGYQHYLTEQRLKSFVPAAAQVLTSKSELHVDGYGNNRTSFWATDITFACKDADGKYQQHTARLQQYTRSLVDIPAAVGITSDQIKMPGSKNTKIQSGFGHNWGNEQSWDQGIWRPETRFTVYLNPYNSDDWSLTQGPTAETYTALGVGLLLALGCGALFYSDLARLYAVEATDPGSEYLPPDDPIAMQITEERHRRAEYGRWFNSDD
jgi:hypothetical protein